MRQLLNPQHDQGRLSDTRDEIFWPYLRHFFAQDIKYARKIPHPLKDRIIDINKIIQIYEGGDLKKDILLYKKYIKEHLMEIRNTLTIKFTT
jgi:hypothetical protein